jgi:hypothetical protein
MTESELMAAATAVAMIAAAAAEDLELPDRIAQDLHKMAAATDQRVLKITHGMTAKRYEPAGPLPNGVARYEWQTARLSKQLPGGWPAVATVDPQPCYVVYVSANGITAEYWLKAAGYEASSNAPFCCTLREVSRP